MYKMLHWSFVHVPRVTNNPSLVLLLGGGGGLGGLLPVASDHDHAEEGADDGGAEEDDDDGDADGPDAGGKAVLEGVVVIDEGLGGLVSWS